MRLVCARCSAHWVAVRRMTTFGQVFLAGVVLACVGAFGALAERGFLATLVAGIIGFWVMRTHGWEDRCFRCGHGNALDLDPPPPTARAIAPPPPEPKDERTPLQMKIAEKIARAERARRR